jgi:hypothetical protein
MNERAALRRLGAFLHLLAAGLFVGTIAELVSAQHYDETIQLVPFALCGLGLLALAALWVFPNRPVVLAVRGLMIVIAAGSLMGIYEHIVGNLGFVQEVRPHANTLTKIKETLTGRDPLLAPGILAIGATLAIAATYVTAVLATRVAVPERRYVSAGRGDGRDWLASDR